MIKKLILFFIENNRITTSFLFIATFAILVGATMPSEQFGSTKIFEFDKPIHLLVFFGWTLLFGLFMFSRKETEAKLILVFITGSMFGIAIELLQDILPIDRSMEMADALADILGSFLALNLLFLIKKKYFEP